METFSIVRLTVAQPPPKVRQLAQPPLQNRAAKYGTGTAEISMGGLAKDKFPLLTAASGWVMGGVLRAHAGIKGITIAGLHSSQS
jgi:hypothetical protein